MSGLRSGNHGNEFAPPFLSDDFPIKSVDLSLEVTTDIRICINRLH